MSTINTISWLMLSWQKQATSKLETVSHFHKFAPTTRIGVIFFDSTQWVVPMIFLSIINWISYHSLKLNDWHCHKLHRFRLGITRGDSGRPWRRLNSKLQLNVTLKSCFVQWWPLFLSNAGSVIDPWISSY